jgi:ABC-type uncharacterized transport system substrate-binding protein
VLASPLSIVQRDLIITLAARHRLPAVYALRFFVTSDGLTCYGPDSIEPYRRAAGYVDRILKGEKPADLPVQTPTKYELAINLKTAKALGLEVPPTVSWPIPEAMAGSRSTAARVTCGAISLRLEDGKPRGVAARPRQAFDETVGLIKHP